MNLLITGATGLIGRATIKYFYNKGFNISILTTTKREKLKIHGVKIFYWNPIDNIIDENALNDIDVIINLCGAKINQRWTKKTKNLIMDSRVKSTKLIVDTLIRKNLQISHFISASAIGIYPHSFNKIFKENCNQFSNTFTGKVVLGWEKEAKKAKNVAINVSLLRIGIVLSKKGGALKPIKSSCLFGFGAWFGNGNQIQSWIHIDDLLEILFFAFRNPGIYNAVSPKSITQKELIKEISKRFVMPSLVPCIPRILSKLLFGEMSEILHDSVNASSEKLVKKGFKFKFNNIEKALDDLL